jgi:hypothetical protein
MPRSQWQTRKRKKKNKPSKTWRGLMTKKKTKVMSTKISISNKTVLEEIQDTCKKATDVMKTHNKDESLVAAATAFVSISSMCQGALSVIEDIEEKPHE